MAKEIILLLGSETSNIKFIEEYVLTPKKYLFSRAANASEAMLPLQEENISCVIADWNSPQTKTALSAIQSLDVLPPLILLAPDGDSGAKETIANFAVAQLVNCPFTIDQMLTAIKQSLKKKTAPAPADSQSSGQNSLLETLKRLNQTALAATKAEPVFSEIVQAALALTQADECALILTDKHGDLLLRAVATRQSEKPAIATLKQRIEDNIAGQVLRTGQPVFMGGQDRHDAFKIYGGRFAKSLLMMPVLHGAKTRGALAVYRLRQSDGFTQSDLTALSHLADFAALAIKLSAAQDTPVLPDDGDFNAESSSLEANASPLEAIAIQLPADAAATLQYLVQSIAGQLTPSLKQILRTVEEPPSPEQTAAIKVETLACQNTLDTLTKYVERGQSTRQPTDLNRAVEQAMTRLKAAIANDEHKVSVEAHLALNLPQIIADSAQLTLAFQQLLTRAWQSLPADGTLHVVTRAVGSEVKAIFKCTPPVIVAEAEKPRHLSDPFHRRAPHPLDLSLSVSQAIIQAHHGLLEIEIDLGTPPIYTVRLPASSADL